MEDPGKLFVVIAVLLVIFTGLITYLVMLDRKIRRFEKETDQKKSSR
ncbi:MAG: hypothetical protein NTU44_09045 [Bacteroidetes bacterium]|nr:hypothetical protein [Bacteroidota bacterium]